MVSRVLANKRDNEAVHPDSGARPEDLEKKYNKDMVRNKEDTNVQAPNPTTEILLKNTHAVLGGDQPMVFTPEIGRMAFQAVWNREPTTLEMQKMVVNAKLSEKHYAEHGSSVGRVTSEAQKTAQELAHPQRKERNFVGMAQKSARQQG